MTRGDWELLTGRPRYVPVLLGLLGPKPRLAVPPPPGRRSRFAPRYRVLGADFSGCVEAVGKGVTQFRRGDEVFGDCGVAGYGSFAEYVCVPERAPMVRKPAGMSFAQAAAIPEAAAIALTAFRRQARLAPGHAVLINGAGGGAGTLAVQVARHFGATVTAVDRPEKLELLRSLGAAHVIDCMREDFTRNRRRYDLILDLAAHRSVLACRRSLAPGGAYFMAGGSGTALWQSALLGPLLSRIGNRRIALLIAAVTREHLALVTELFVTGAVAPVIDRLHPLREAGDALRRLGEQRSLGKVILTP